MREFWDQRYGAEVYGYGTAPNQHLAAWAKRIPAGPVLCLASGEGRNAVFLATRGHDVTAVDFSRSGLDKTARLAAQHGVEVTLVHADLAGFDPGEGQWAGIISVFAHVPPPVRRALHARVFAALRPGGVLILEAYTPAQVGRGTGGPPVAGPMMQRDELIKELPGLVWLRAEEVERSVVEGLFHTGEASVVQMVGRRPADS